MKLPTTRYLPHWLGIKLRSSKAVALLLVTLSLLGAAAKSAAQNRPIMVFTLLAEPSIAKGTELKGKKIGITRIGSVSDLAVCTVLEQFGVNPTDVTMIALGGIPEILAAMRADDRTLEGCYKKCDAAISSSSYPGIKGLEAVRDSLWETTPQLKNADLRKFVDDRFVRAK